MNTKRYITERNFFSGIFAVLALADITALANDNSLEEKMAQLFAKFSEHAEKADVEMRFRILLHPIHRDSITVQRGILEAMGRGILSSDMPGCILRNKLTPGMAQFVLEDINQNIFDDLAEEIVQTFSS